MPNDLFPDFAPAKAKKAVQPLTPTPPYTTLDEEADALERIKADLDDQYGPQNKSVCIHPDTGKPVTDTEYDMMVLRLKAIRPNSDALNEYSGNTHVGGKKVKHSPPMVSIEKANGTLEEKNDILAQFVKDCMTELKYDTTKTTHPDGEPYFVQSLKHDGVAVALYYVNGNFDHAGLRPHHGQEGDDVSDTIVKVAGVPMKLPFPWTCVIGGEVECALSAFQKINDEIVKKGGKAYKNTRNYTNGSLHQDDPEVTAKRMLHFTAYRIDGVKNPPWKTAKERAIFANKQLGLKFVRIMPFKYSDLEKIEKEVLQTLDFEIDGVVIEVNNIEDAEQMGRVGDSPTGNPRAKLAWKFEEKPIKAPIQQVDWQTGRTGVLTPVAKIPPTEIAGVTVQKCTLNNLGFMLKHGLGVGAVAGFIRSGKVIPKCVEVYQKAPKVVVPTCCPSCGAKVEEQEGESKDPKTGKKEKTKLLYCTNTKTCPAQNIETMLNYLRTFGVKGLGDSIVTALVEEGQVRTFADFYELTPDDIAAVLDDKSERKATLAYAAIHMIPSPDKEKSNQVLVMRTKKAAASRKQIPLADFFATLGIHGAGKTTGRELADHFRSMDAIRTATVTDLLSVPNMGDITAQSVYDWFQNNKDNLDRLLKHVDPVPPKIGKLSGVTFCLSGGFDDGKDHWEKAITDLGGKVVGSVSKKVNYLVYGPGSGAKSAKADELGIPKITVDKLKAML